jgi:predicted short-subunit dehydrogenase-like oxidoreductase (DUF2520 family)
MTLMKTELKVVIIGAGRVGFHLAKRLFEVGIPVSQIFSRQQIKANKLANLIQAEPISDLSKVSKDADLYILAVSDDAITEVAKKLSKILKKDSFLVHTSGATSSAVFEEHFKRYGILYPLQSFSFEKKPDFSNIPICIDSQNPLDLAFLTEIANEIGPKVYCIDDDQRQFLHVSAVFVNNFVNHLYFLGKEILDEEEISMELLKPLIIETANKIIDNDPKAMQTGPAIRGDTTTIKAHLELIENKPEIHKLYQYITKSIQKHHS